MGREDAMRELKRGRDEAMKRNASLRSKVGGGNNQRRFVKDFSRKDFDENKDYYVALLNLVPMIGAAHWFSSENDVTDSGKRYSAPRNCSANLNPDMSFGDNPEVCPACWLSKYQREYYAEHNVLPNVAVPVDVYENKPNMTQLLIYYYAMVGEPKEILVRDSTTGKESRKIEVAWWDDPVVLLVKPSINNIIAEHLNNEEEYDGDIRAYLWRFRKKKGSGFDKYEETGPLMSKGALVPVPKEFVANRNDMLNKLPKATELLKPTSPDEMADLLGIPDWKEKKSSTPVDSVSVDEDVDIDTGDIDIDLGEDDSEFSDIELDDDISLSDLDNLD